MDEALPEDGDPGTVIVFSDYLCPFCYIGKASLERYREDAEDPPDVAWHPYDIQGHKRGPDGDLDHDVQDGKDEAYFERARESAQRLADRYGVDIAFDLPSETDSWDAQQLALYVREHRDADTFDALHDAIFEAVWTDNRDVGDPDVLRDVAASVGLDPDVVDEALADDRTAELLAAQFEEARRAGVRGIPTFVVGDEAAQGAVPPEHLERLVAGDPTQQP